jgi:hypothetical protein
MDKQDASLFELLQLYQGKLPLCRTDVARNSAKAVFAKVFYKAKHLAVLQDSMEKAHMAPDTPCITVTYSRTHISLRSPLQQKFAGVKN